MMQDAQPSHHIICMAKGIASGFPFAALATIEVMSDPGFLPNVVERGAHLVAGLRDLQREQDGIEQDTRQMSMRPPSVT